MSRPYLQVFGLVDAIVQPFPLGLQLWVTMPIVTVDSSISLPTWLSF